ncbi:Forkhead box protein L1 [Coemansia sp. IMI 209127]|nr:Forkhead box protein L1 [Coemansia sp. IMI 209127]
MNPADFSAPSRSQQQSPAPILNHQLAASTCPEMRLPASMALQYHPMAMSPMDIVTPSSAVDLGSAHFAHLKDTFNHRPFSPSAMDFAGMNIASGYHTPHLATPVTMQQQQPPPPPHQQLTPMDIPSTPITSAAPSAAPGAASTPAASISGTSTPTSGKSKTPNPDKPDYSYASLIAQSLMEAPVQRRTLNGIYEWIQEHFPYYRTRQNWQNSIRHNLSLNKGFMKVKRDEAHPGKGSFWTFTPGYESCLNSGHFKPIRSRSGRAALAAAAAIAAAKDNMSLTEGSGGDEADQETDSTVSPVGAGNQGASRIAESGVKKADKKIIRSIKAAKSLKRSHSLPPKEPRNPHARGAASKDGSGTLASMPAGSSLVPSPPCALSHSSTMPEAMSLGRSSAKKMRVSSSHSHNGVAMLPISASALSSVSMAHVSAASAFSNIPAISSYPHTPSFAPSPAPYMPSPGLMHHPSSMPVINADMRTPLNQSAQFNFHMPSPCSIPLSLSAIDMASVPTTSADGGVACYPMGGAFFGGPFAGSGADSVAATGIEGTALFSPDNASMGSSGDSSIFNARRSNVPSRISWHGPESMTQAFATVQQQQHPNGMGMPMGLEHTDLGLSVFTDGRSQGMSVGVDNSVSASPADWAMMAGIPVSAHVHEVAVAADLSMNASLQNMCALDSQTPTNCSFDCYQQQQIHQQQQPHPRMVGLSAVDATVPASAGSCNGSSNANGNPGIMSFYDEMIRDPASLMNVFGQDLSGWQCPTKTNTIDPAALCAVDPEANTL